MLSVIRKHSGSWMVKAILIAVAVTFFGGFGILTLFRRGCEAEDTVARVNGKQISHSLLEKSYENLKSRYRERLGSQFDDELAQRLQLKQQSLNLLINRELILDEARRLRFTVTEQEVTDILARIPGFQDSNGKFSRARYEQILRFNRTAPEEYEANQRLALLIAKFERFVKSSVRITDDEVSADFVKRNERAKLSYLKIGPAEGARRAKVGRSEIEEYYGEHQKDFQNPPRRRFIYAVFDPSLHREGIGEDLDQAEIEDKSNRLAWEAAQKAAKDARENESLSELGKRHNLSVRETGFISSDADIDGSPELAARAFALLPGEISPAIFAGGKYYLLQTAEVKPAETKPLAEVSGDIRKKLEEEKGKSEALNIATDALESLQETRSLRRVSRRFGLPLQKTEFFSRGDTSVPGIGNSPEIFQAAFSLSKEQPNGEKVYSFEGNYYLISLEDREKADLNQLAEEKDEIKQKMLTLKQEVAFQGYLMNLREKADLEINFEKLEE